MTQATESRLLILRHGKTEVHAASGQDFDRALIARGINNSRDMGAIIKERCPRPDIALVSPAMRARQTAEYALAAAAYNPAPLIIHDERIYSASPDNLIRVIADAAAQNAHAKTAILIGHNPSLVLLAEIMLAETDKGIGHLPTCGLVDIAFPDAQALADIAAGQGRLAAMLTPKNLSLPSRAN